jgi:hypothetical protein
MGSKEFYNNHKGEYFIHKNKKVRIIGYNDYHFDALIVSMNDNTGERCKCSQEFINYKLLGNGDSFRYALICNLKEITEQNKKTVMETRNVKITLETAKRWYEQGGEFKEMALSAFTEAELNPIRNEWESKFIGKEIKGYYSTNSKILEAKGNCSGKCKDIFKTEKQAKSALAYAQLTQLMALPEYNGDWVPDWSDDDLKYIIRRYGSGIDTDYYSNTHHHIFFKSSEIRDKFLENNLDLLKEYFELD